MSHNPLTFRTASLKWGVFAIPVVSSVLISAPSTYAQIPCEYEVTAIIQAPECPPFGFPPTIGTAISEPIDGGLPYVVGYVQSCVIGPDVAFLWTPDQGIQLIPTPPGTIRSWAFDITPDGAKIAGSFDLSGDGLGNLAFLYDHETGKFTNLGTLPGGNWSEALAINAKRVATGFWGNNNNPPWQVFLWKNGEMIDIGPQLNGPNNIANDISDTGERIVGWMGTSLNIDSHAFIWDDGDVTELPFITSGYTSAGRAINCRGDVAGFGWIFDKDANEDVRRAFAWIDGEMILLGTLPGYPESSATGINDDRTVVGHAFTNTSRAFVWTDGLMTALNDLVPPELGLNIKSAKAINQTGQITGTGTSPDGVVTFVLTPVAPPIGDLDGDCHVGVSDLLILLTSWGPCIDCNDCPADLDGDCGVGVSDLLALLANWG